MADKHSTQLNSLASTWLVEILKNNKPVWPSAKTEDIMLEELVTQTAHQHGVLSLCTYLLLETPAWNTIPQSLHTRLKKSIRQEAALEAANSFELNNVLTLLAKKDIHPLLLKGTPLSYSHYPQPYLRPRCDSDLLFPDKQSADDAWQLLRENGYTRPTTVSGDLVSYQFTGSKSNKAGINCNLDCHWAISNNQFFARLLSFRELEQQAIAVPRISDYALALGHLHALLLACMHLVSHKSAGNANRLIWFYDIHLLCNSFSKTDWHQFLLLASQKKICSICMDGLTKTMQILQTQVPSNIIEELSNKAKNERFTEKIGTSRFHRILTDFRTLPGWRQRTKFLKEYFFPDVSYMQKKYGINSKLLVPFLYIIRSVHGIYKIVRQLTLSK